MAKTKISEFSATPANNTDIDSINIAEGCAPSGINDAIRELMAQLKDFQTGAVGDSFNGPIGTSTAAAGAFTTLSASSTTTLSGLTASTALALDASKNVVSVTNTGTGSNVLATSPTLVTPNLGVPSFATLTSATGLPISTGVSGLGTGIATFLATPSSANLAAALTDETGSGANVFATSPTLVTPTLGVATGTSFQGIIGNVTPAAGSFTTLGASSTATLNTLSSSGATLTGGTINGMTVGATTPSSGAFTTVTASTAIGTASGGTGLGGATPFTSGGVVYASSASVLATGSALTFDGTNLSTTGTLGVGAFAASSTVGLNVRFIGNLTSTDIQGVGSSISAPATASSSTINFYSSLRTTATSGSRGLLYNFYAEGPTIGATSTANTIYGFMAKNQGNAGISNAYGVYIEAQSGSPTTNIGLRNGGTSRLDGNVGLNTAPAASGTGITFPATDSPSSDANTLDDYEEGTWTPTLTISSGTITLSSPNLCVYTKIGRVVTVNGLADVNSVSTPVGNSIAFNNLPFTSNATGSQRSAGTVVGINLTSGNVSTTCVIVSSATSFIAQLNASLVQTASQIYFQLSYVVD